MADAGPAAFAALLLGALGAVALGLLSGRALRARARVRANAARVDRILQQARLSADALLRGAAIAAREQALVLRGQVEQETLTAQERLARQAGELSVREARLQREALDLAELRQRLRAREAPLQARETGGRRQVEVTAGALGELRARLERVAGVGAEALRSAVAGAEVELARGEAVRALRQGEGELAAEARRRAAHLLGIAGPRFSGHTLTERGLALVPLTPLPSEDLPAVTPGELQAIEGVTGLRLTLADAGDLVRIDGLDGVAREVARRTLARLLAGQIGGGATAVAGAAREAAAELEQEVIDLGQRAFATLAIERAHPDIVRLVGRLNWRTSHTQNQWHHAVEAAFLCGMMADELGLDRALARRAALLHDIGKSLTHELDGAHAVIGADYARRLGEREEVANAIGAHHADEPFASPYALLCAAADAMSGARPGARRHSEDNYLARIADLERLSREFPGVAEAFAVQGGREVRVLVREQEIDDLGAVQLSTSIAQAITNRLAFPGQIRVTVIRELRAVARTGA
jgi:ribonucrease Y